MRVRVHFGLSSLGVEPVADVRARSPDNGVTKLAVIILNQLSQVVNAVKEGNPAVVVLVVLLHLGGGVKAPQLVGLGQVLGVLQARGILVAGRGHSSCHGAAINYYYNLNYGQPVYSSHYPKGA